AKSIIFLVHPYNSSCRRVNAEQVRADVGEFTEREARGKEGVRTTEAAEHLVILITAYWRLGHLCLRKGDLDEAIPGLERGLSFREISQNLGLFYSGRCVLRLPLRLG